MGSSSAVSCLRAGCRWRRRDPQYQHIKSPSASTAIAKVLQNRTEKGEIESVSVSWRILGNSSSCTVAFFIWAILVWSWLYCSSRWVAWVNSPEGSANGLKSHWNTKGSGFIRMLWSDLRVWLNNLSVQPGLTLTLVVVLMRTGECEPLLQVIWAVCG